MNPPAGDPRVVVRAVRRALEQAPAYRGLDAETRRDLSDSLARIGDTVGLPVGSLAGAPAPAADQPPVGTGTPGPVARVGDVARHTLEAIDFPSFVSGLVKGTFQAIVDASVQQMEAYATLLKEVAKTVDDYMEDNVTEGAARDYLTDRYPTVFRRDTSSGTAELEVDRSNPAAPLPTFFKGLGFDNATQLDPGSVEEVVVPAVRKTIAEQRHQTLATMVLLGLNRIVVDDGEINAKLQFHIDASETTGITFDSTQTSMGNMAGMAGQSRFSGQGIMVNTASINAQSDLNVRADLTGEVRIRFSSDVMPLERFADSHAIQLINQHATVPPAPSTPAEKPEDGASRAEPVAQQAVTQQSVPAQAADDPWSPRR